MKYRWDKKYLYWGVTAFCVIAISILFFYGVFHFNVIKTGFFRWVKILMPVIYGLTIGYLLAPAVNYIEKHILKPLLYKKCKVTERIKNKKRIRGLSIFITLLLVISLVSGLFILLIPQLLVSISSLIIDLPVYYQNFMNGFRGVFINNPNLESTVIANLDVVSKYLEEFLNNQILPSLNDYFVQFTSGIFDFISVIKDLFIGVIISIYVLNSKELFAAQFKKCIYAILKPQRANIVIKDLRLTNEMFSGFISGTLLDSFIIGIICFVATQIMGTPYGILVSVIICVTNVIPFFGPYLGAIPSGLLILFVSPIHCIYFIIFIIVLQNFDGNILAPRIIGHNIGLSSFWVIVSILISGGLFGVFGLFIGVPVFAILYSLVKSSINRVLSANNLPLSTSNYSNLYYMDGLSNAMIYDDNSSEEESKIRLKIDELKMKRDEKEEKVEEKKGEKKKENQEKNK